MAQRSLHDPPQPLRLVYCTSGGLYGALVLDRLRRCPEIQVVGILLSTRILRKHYGWWQGALEQFRVSGLPYTLYLWCATGLADTLGRFARIPSLARQIHEAGIPLHRTRDVNDAASLAFVAAQVPDLLLAGFFNQRLGDAVCALPRLGAVNLHPGILPAFRGVDPVFAAMHQGQKRLGVTLHRVTAAFDAGPILGQDASVDLGQASLLRATATLFCRGAELLLEHLDRLREGDPGLAQTGTEGYASWPTPDEVDEFLDRGGYLVRWPDLQAMLAGRFCRSDAKPRRVE